MSIEQTVEQLKTKAGLMGSYYYKGFITHLTVIQGHVQWYLTYPEERDGHESKALSLYSRIEKFYERIPFEELEDERFAPLFRIRRLLPSYKALLQQVLASPTREGYRQLVELNHSIVNISRPYEQNFEELVGRIRAIPGNEDFYVKVIDNQGNVWQF